MILFTVLKTFRFRCHIDIPATVKAFISSIINSIPMPFDLNACSEWYRTRCSYGQPSNWCTTICTDCTYAISCNDCVSEYHLYYQVLINQYSPAIKNQQLPPTTVTTKRATTNSASSPIPSFGQDLVLHTISMNTTKPIPILKQIAASLKFIFPVAK